MENIKLCQEKSSYYSTAMKTLGERLKNIQKNSGKTLPEFAKDIGISRDSLINYQQNRTFPDSRILATICEKFGINPTWLLIGEGEPFRGEKKEEPGKVDEEKKIVYFDDATQILLEAEKEMGVTLNEKQRQSVLKVLRKELALSQAKALVRAVKEEENQD